MSESFKEFPYNSVGPLVAGLLLCLALVAAFGGLCVALVLRHRKLHKPEPEPAAPDAISRDLSSTQIPSRWLAIKSANSLVVQSALGLHNLKPCTWQEGLSQVQDRDLLVSAPVDGWILVTGGGLPSPENDIDVCFHWLQRLSKDLGTVQLFSIHPALSHHAWAVAQEGSVVRAYAWAGHTLWNQGRPTSAERQLGMTFFPYGEKEESLSSEQKESLVLNSEKVGRLAGAWSIDPLAVVMRLENSKRSVVGNLAQPKAR